MKTIYIAGPMTGYPQMNFPMFDHVEQRLEDAGWCVISPATMDRAEGFDPTKEKGKIIITSQFMKDARKRDLLAISDHADALVLLPGWQCSSGALAEKALAEWKGIEIFTWSDLTGLTSLASMLLDYRHVRPEFRSESETREKPASEKVYNAYKQALPVLAGGSVDAMKKSCDDFGFNFADGEAIGVIPTGTNMVDQTSKPTNPKDAIGSDKVPIHLWPSTATLLGSLAMLDGALKYGRSNFRAIGVRASIYHDACMRHITRWFEGESDDPDSGLPHLAHALACLAIIIDAEAAGKLNDDRMVAGDYDHLLGIMTPHVKRLKDKYAGRNPKHHTIQDNPKS